jgi:hypothetical protein
MRSDLVHQCPRNRLHDEMDVTRSTAPMRPEVDVDLIRLGQPSHDRCDSAEQRTERVSFVVVELPHVQDVAPRLHDECPDPEWSDAMLYQPATLRKDDAAGEISPALAEVACETALHTRLAGEL